ncbi:MAG: diguanylate cyclase [Bacilli bacterium]
MNSYFRVDVNIVSAFVLALIVFIAFRRLDRKDKLSQAFFTTSVIIIFQLIIEAVTCLINTRTESWVNPLAVILHICLFITAPTLTFYWYIMLRRLINPNDKMKKPFFLLISIPFLINLIITLLSPFFKLVFYIDSTNVYHRGDYFFLSALVCYSYLIFGLIRITRKSQILVRRDLYLMYLSTIIPIVGGILQSLIYGILLMWSSVAFALIIVYIFLQQRLVPLDTLTSTWNRESFDFYINEKFKNTTNQNFGAIYLDLDDLKEINDQFGHFEGDLALQETSKILKQNIKDGDIVARLGGDEFIIISVVANEDEIKQLNDKIVNAFALFNNVSTKPYRLEISSGADVYNKRFSTFDQFIRHIDNLMYETKRFKKKMKES